jgi:hypothetical protein
MSTCEATIPSEEDESRTFDTSFSYVSLFNHVQTKFHYSRKEQIYKSFAT